MTATPRIYDDTVKDQGAGPAIGRRLCRWTTRPCYGPEFHRLGFGEAVEQGPAHRLQGARPDVDEEHISQVFQAQLADRNNELPLEDGPRSSAAGTH